MASDAELSKAIQDAKGPEGLSSIFNYFSEAIPQLDPEDFDIVVPLDFNGADRDEVYAYFGNEDGSGEIGSVNMYRLKDEGNIVYQGALTDKGFENHKDRVENYARNLCAEASAKGVNPREVSDFSGEMGDVRNEVRGYYRSIQSKLVENERLYGDNIINEEDYKATRENLSDIYEKLDDVAKRIDAVRGIDANELDGIRENIAKEVNESDLENKDKILAKADLNEELKQTVSPSGP